MSDQIKLRRCLQGNPFTDHPALREIFGERSVHVEADTLADLNLGDADPHKNRVFLIELDSVVVGITGFFQPDAGDATSIALRWHGVIPTHRGRGYSEAAFEAVRQLAIQENPEAKRIVELVPMADPVKSDRLLRHFRALGFHPAGLIKDATEFPASTALPQGSGRWQVMHHHLLAPTRKFVGKFIF